MNLKHLSNMLPWDQINHIEGPIAAQWCWLRWQLTSKQIDQLPTIEHPKGLE